MGLGLLYDKCEGLIVCSFSTATQKLKLAYTEGLNFLSLRLYYAG